MKTGTKVFKGDILDTGVDTLFIPYEEIIGDIKADAARIVSAPFLKKITGNIRMNSAEDVDMPELIEVEGYLHTSMRNKVEDAKINLPKLKFVAISCSNDCFPWFTTTGVKTLKLPSLVKTGGAIIMPSTTILEMPLLEECGSIETGAKVLRLPKLNNLSRKIGSGCLNALEATYVSLPKLEESRTINTPLAKPKVPILEKSAAIITKYGEFLDAASWRRHGEKQKQKELKLLQTNEVVL